MENFEGIYQVTLSNFFIHKTILRIVSGWLSSTELGYTTAFVFKKRYGGSRYNCRPEKGTGVQGTGSTLSLYRSSLRCRSRVYYSLLPIQKSNWYACRVVVAVDRWVDCWCRAGPSLRRRSTDASG
eukprot:2879594-Rhodomonas_salina.1